jgi:urea transport system ATP-binding protein
MDPRTTTALLYLSGVTVSFDGFRALNNLSFTVDPGEMRAVIGPNGAGKTTMMDVVTGKTRADIGEVYFDGSYDLSRLDETEIALLGVGRKFQKPTVFDMHTVEDNIGLALKGDRRARKPRRHSTHPAAPAQSRASLPRPETVARDRHAARAGTEAPSG